MDKAPEEVVELDSRVSDKVRIALWWVRGTIDTYVTVTDYDAQIEVVVAIPEGESPHDVYNHAMAYLPSDPETT